MAVMVDENASFSISRFQDSASLEHRPMMLKDFLRDDCFHSCTSSSSSSSNGIGMYPRQKPCKSNVVVSSESNKPAIVLLRSWSKKAAATKISAIHKVVNVVKLFQLASVKSPLVLPRSISRKLPKRGKDKNDILGDVSEGKVKVKDILRWRSFRDMVEDDSTPLDFPSSPNRSTTTTTTSCSKRSSWCDSDFTAEELPLWGGENEEFLGKKCFLGQPAATNATLRNPKGDWSFEDCEQQSPVSVLDSPFREIGESISPFHPTLANVQRAKCMLTRRIQELEGVAKPKYTRKLSFGGEIVAISEGVNAVEEKAKQLLSHVKEDSRSQANHVILDFFMHELSINGNLHDVEFDCEILRIAKSWMNGEYDESYEWEVEDKRDAYVKDMEKGAGWNKFKQEQEETSKELEVKVWDELIDELLADF
ncbi:hypothetical protein Pfo_001288 [Paulownia fortunei]|nr:hypothetical protein Pfo_001288 [Paulownia fortunei]